jgi:hypothetical protein
VRRTIGRDDWGSAVPRSVAIKGGHIIETAALAGLAGVLLVAIRDVNQGEELTTDYALFDTSPGEMACRCRTPSCRRTITGADWQLGELQVKYAGYFSSYIQRRIESTGRRARL